MSAFGADPNGSLWRIVLKNPKSGFSKKSPAPSTCLEARAIEPLLEDIRASRGVL
jgi:hypothetical protein